MALYQDAERLINEAFWKETHDKRSTLDLKEIINKKLLEERKLHDKDYYESKRGVVHVSSLSRCLSGVVLEMLGMEPDKKETQKEIDNAARKLGVFKAGNLFEDFVISSLGERVLKRQSEYSFHYKNLTLVGRSDFLMNDAGIMRVGEVKSVHTDSFWYREKEGTLIAWHNQIQLQVYMWLERLLNHNEFDGVFAYVSKDDVTVINSSVKFNQRIIDEVVIPALDVLNEIYQKIELKTPGLTDAELIRSIVPMPQPVVYSDSKGQYQKNWLCTYCEWHKQCAGDDWEALAAKEVMRKNKELKVGMPQAHLSKQEKSVIKPV